jgi:hypothetical protein
MHQLIAQYSRSGGVTPSGVQQAAPVVFAGVFLIFVLIFAFVMIALVLFIWGTIFKKAGYSFWMALLMIVPIANLVWLLVFAFSKWPIQQELEMLRGQSGYPPRGYAGGGFPVPPAR